MKLHEYQSRGLFGQYAGSVLKRPIVDFLERAVEADLGAAAGAKAAEDPISTILQPNETVRKPGHTPEGVRRSEKGEHIERT
jgi:hypothetical protein